MGKRGPKPTPTAMLEARGSWRAGLREGEPKPEPITAVACPKWLKGPARRWWPQVSQELIAMGVLTTADLLACSMLVDQIGWYMHWRAMLESEGKEMQLSKDGMLKMHPAWAAMNEAWDRVLKASREFGMTPSSRVGLTTSKAEKNNDGKKRFFK